MINFNVVDFSERRSKEDLVISSFDAPCSLNHLSNIQN